MESVIGLIIFVAILSLISRFSQQKQAGDSGQPQRRVRAEDLPEKTRRLLYGDDVKTARPRQMSSNEEETTQPRSAPFEEGRPLDMRDLLDALRGEPAQRPPSYPTTERVSEVRRIREEVRRVKPYPVPPKPTARATPPHPKSPRRSVQQSVRPKQAPLPPREGPKPTPPSRVKPAEVPGRQVRADSYGFRKLIRSPKGLKYGIILSEVLGPPKAFRL